MVPRRAKSEGELPGSVAGRPERLGRFVSPLMLALLMLAVALSIRIPGHGGQHPGDRGYFLAASDTSKRPLRLGLVDTTVSLYQLPYHPSIKLSPYIPLVTPDQRVLVQEDRYIPFYQLLDSYVVRQAVDDNFTVRVLDDRTGKVLEIYELKEERSRFRRTGVGDWGRVDALRREVTGRLTKKYADLGIPRGSVVVRWGRANQVEEAWLRDEPYVAYEIRLAQWLDLSLLVGELGTVETFNQDDLVSRAGARSRYQLMPTMLRRFGLRQHTLQTVGGRTVNVREEQHPLLVLVPAFSLVRAYTNAVGHELLGISSYHTGPYNIFKIIELYLSEVPESRRGANVLDGYVWALTEGFDQVSRKSSFRTQSRGYIPSAYGSLRAVEHHPIDFSQTFLGEQVPLRSGTRFTLTDLLAALDGLEPALDWGHTSGLTTVYQRFSALNPHLRLPPLTGDAVPDNDNLIFSAQSGPALRLFLPLGAAEGLENAGMGWFDVGQTLRFDHYLFSTTPQAEKTALDAAYDRLIADIERFGFTEANRRSLDQLEVKFEQAARIQPTLYRKIQADVISLHAQLWSSRYWDRVAAAVTDAFGTDPRKRYPDASTPAAESDAGIAK